MRIVSRKKYEELQKAPLKEEGLNTYEIEYTVTYTKNVKAASPSEAQSTIRKEYDGNNVAFRATRELKGDSLSEDFGDEFLGEPENIDDPVDISGVSDQELTPEAPEGEDAGMTTVINSLITDEIEAIDGYNSAIQTARELDLGGAVTVLSSIADEENAHVGELQTVLTQFSDQAQSIKAGEQEARDLLNAQHGVTERVYMVNPEDNVDGEIRIDMDDIDDEIFGIESYM